MKRIMCITGIIAGALMIFFGIKLCGISFYDRSFLLSAITFGADFYTEQYSVTRQAALGINELGKLLEDVFNGVGMLSAAAGLATTAG
ncbi:MAG: hypothetical protein IJ080_08865, partial [Oscillospiraceae bacterium]|nr:hypothetical protein [Oscillospiraceae bacterium]